MTHSDGPTDLGNGRVPYAGGEEKNGDKLGEAACGAAYRAAYAGGEDIYAEGDGGGKDGEGYLLEEVGLASLLPAQQECKESAYHSHSTRLG